MTMPAIEYIITDEDTGKQIGDPIQSRAKAHIEARRLRNEDGRNVGLRHRHATPSSAPAADTDELNDLTVAELKEKARSLDLAVSGNKAELVERIRAAS